MLPIVLASAEYASCAWYEITRCVRDCCIGRLEMSRLDLLLCTNHTHIHRDDWHKGMNLQHGCRCAAAAVLVVLLHAAVLILSSRGLGGAFETTPK